MTQEFYTPDWWDKYWMKRRRKSLWQIFKQFRRILKKLDKK